MYVCGWHRGGTALQCMPLWAFLLPSSCLGLVSSRAARSEYQNLERSAVEDNRRHEALISRQVSTVNTLTYMITYRSSVSTCRDIADVVLQAYSGMLIKIATFSPCVAWLSHDDFVRKYVYVYLTCIDLVWVTLLPQSATLQAEGRAPVRSIQLWCIQWAKSKSGRNASQGEEGREE